MPRPIKEGLDYFPLDVDIDQDDKIALIEAKHGLVGFSIVIKLFLKIYDNSYFYQWTEKEQLLFSKRINVDINLINEVINDCLKWEIFSDELYKAFGILTSRGIQRRYLEATLRRKKVKIPKEHLLLDSDAVYSYKNLVIVDNNSIDTGFSTQRKVEESKGKKSKEEDAESPPDDPFIFFENHIGPLGPHIVDRLKDWTEEFPEDVMTYSMELAVESNKRNFNYCNTVLSSWKKEGVKNLADAKRINQEFKERHSNVKPFRPKTPEEAGQYTERELGW